jgi:hypothetical protein
MVAAVGPFNISIDSISAALMSPPKLIAPFLCASVGFVGAVAIGAIARSGEHAAVVQRVKISMTTKDGRMRRMTLPTHHATHLK